MKSALRILYTGLKIEIKTRIAYRMDFLVSSLLRLFTELFIPLLTLLIYRTGRSFPGWTIYEVLLIQSVFLISKGIAFPFLWGVVWNTMDKVREGTFDLILLKPHSPILITISSSFDSEEASRLIGGIVLFIYSADRLGGLPLFSYLKLFLMVLLSVLVISSFAILMTSVTFKWIGNSRLFEIFENISLISQYPFSIYTKAFRDVFTMIVPIGMIGFIPASVFLDKEVTGLSFSILACIALLFLSVFIWRYMIKKYSSAGG